MTKATLPFPLPSKLPLDLERIRGYWENLKRAENEMPFWDDVKLSSLPDLSDCLMLVDVFENPQRFRFNSVGKKIRELYDADLTGKFVDEIPPKIPLTFFIAQASVTIEAKLPTFFNNSAATGSWNHYGYSRLLLPMWGNGHIEMMLGGIAIEPLSKTDENLRLAKRR